MPSISSIVRPAYSFDAANNVWVPIGGAPGATGPTGSQGIQGIQGIQGTAGAAGAAGAGADVNLPIALAMGQY